MLTAEGAGLPGSAGIQLAAANPDATQEQIESRMTIHTCDAEVLLGFAASGGDLPFSFDEPSMRSGLGNASAEPGIQPSCVISHRPHPGRGGGPHGHDPVRGGAYRERPQSSQPPHPGQICARGRSENRGHIGARDTFGNGDHPAGPVLTTAPDSGGRTERAPMARKTPDLLRSKVSRGCRRRRSAWYHGPRPSPRTWPRRPVRSPGPANPGERPGWRRY